uniref:Uncharacterized protein n=1 Tax=Vespula pensylvanica TaxID=30213 RepID=A0A834UE84_VESPE|nr:hypothetical protein H0235_002915 [Vespula pensylvanica]
MESPFLYSSLNPNGVVGNFSKRYATKCLYRANRLRVETTRGGQRVTDDARVNEKEREGRSASITSVDCEVLPLKPAPNNGRSCHQH